MESENIDRALVHKTAREILEKFDRPGMTRLGAAELTAAPGCGAAAEAALTHLIEAQCLLESFGQYERTEVGRLEVAGPLDLTLLSREGCHLCEEALRQIEPLAARFGVRLRVVDVDTDNALRERYHTHVPVAFLGPRELARHQIDPLQIQAELAQTRRSR